MTEWFRGMTEMHDKAEREASNQLLFETARELGALEYTCRKYREAFEAILRTGNVKGSRNTAAGHAHCKQIARDALPQGAGAQKDRTTQ